MWNVKFIQRKQTDGHNVYIMFKQNVRLWLKHKLASVLAIGQLYHQSATAPGCTIQLRDVRGLPLFVTRSSKPVSFAFLNIFFSIFLCFLFLSGNSRMGRRAPYSLLFDSCEFQSKLCLLQYHFKIFISYLLKFTWQWRHVYVRNEISK